MGRRLARLFDALLRTTERMSRGLLALVERLKRQLVELWLELIATAHDVGFRLSLLLGNVGRIALMLSPGLVPLIGGLIWASIPAALAGVSICAAMLAGAYFMAPATEHDEGTLDVHWALFFPPRWLSNPSVALALRPLVTGFVTTETHCDLALRGVARREPLRTLVADARRQLRLRMHRLRGAARALLRKGRSLRGEHIVERTRDAFDALQAVLELLERLGGPVGPDGELDLPDDDLDEVIERLRAVVATLETLDR